LAIKFHESLTEENIIFIEDKLFLFSYDSDSILISFNEIVSLHCGVSKNIATFFQKKRESIEHYTNEIRRIANLTQGTGKTDFVV